jgi:RimJ/RimL family protein N-acetyltransferase
VSDELLTARLRLRRWGDGDVAAMTAINRDPEVTRYLNAPTHPAAVAAFLDRVRAHWDVHGFGYWAVEPRGGGELLGFAGVAHPAFLESVAHRPELGWRLARAAWGRGYATEAATAARDDALGRLGLDELISIIHPANARSRRVASKLGMSVETHVRHPLLGVDVEIWRTSPPCGGARSA